MADPLSIITGCATLTGLALRACRLLTEVVESIQDAPSEIRTILIELKSVEAVTAHISRLCTNPDPNRHPWPDNWLSDVEAAIDECQNSVMDLMNLARRWREQNPSSFGRALNGFRWSLRERDVVAYKRKLDSSKATLIMLLGTWTMMTGNHVGQQLGQVHDMVQGLVAEHIVNANESREVVSSDPMLESLDALVAERIVDNQTALKAQLTSGSGEASSSSSGGPSARTGSNHPQSTSGPSKLSKKGRSAIPSASTKPGASPYTASGPGRRPSFFNRGSRSTAPDASTDPRAKKSNHLPPLFADNAPTPPNTSSQERRGGRLASISSSQSMSSLVGTPQSPPRASGQDTQPHPSTHQRSRSDLAERESDKIFVSQVDPIPNYHISLPHDSVYDQAGMSWHSWLDETTRNPRPLPAGYFSAGLSSLPRYRTVGSPLPVYELAAEFTPPSWPEPTAELTPPSWPEPTTGLTPPSWPEPPPPCSWHETLLRPRSEPPLPTGLICELSAEPPSRSRHRRVVVSIDFDEHSVAAALRWRVNGKDKMVVLTNKRIPLVVYYSHYSVTAVGWGNQPGVAEDLRLAENCVRGDGFMRADLLRCFLGHFYRWIKSVLKLFFMGVYQHAVEGMQYVIVVPASWSHAQTSIMKRLLMCSDFRGSIDDTSFVLDSEAILWSNTALPLTPSGEGRAWRKRLNPFEVAVVVNADEDSGSIKSFRRIGDTFQARPFLHGEYFPLENLESSSETAFDETFTSLQHMVACSVKCEDDERPEHDITGGLILMERFKTLAAEKFIATGLFRDLDCMPEKRLTCEIDVSEISKRNFYISMEQLQGDITAWVLSLAEMVRDHIIGISESKAAVFFTDVQHILMVGGVFDSSSVTTLLENELQDGQLLSLGYDDTWQDRPHDNTMVKHRFPYNYLPHENTMADGPSIHYLPHRTTAVLAGALAKATIHDLVVSGIWLESDLVVELTTLHGSTSHVLKRGQSWLPAAKLLEYDYTWRVPDEIWEDMFRLGTPAAGDLSLMFRVVTEGSRPSIPKDYPPALEASNWATRVDRDVLENLGFVPGVGGRLGTGFKPQFVVVRFRISFVVDKVRWVVVLKGSAVKAGRAGHATRGWEINETEDEWRVISSFEKGFESGGF